MNGWEKITGLLIALSGIVYIVAIALGVADGLSIKDDCLEVFMDLKQVAHLTALAGVVAIIAGCSTLCLGASKPNGAMSILGIVMVFLGTVVSVIAFKDDVSTLTWESLEIILISVCIAVALAAALVCACTRKYFLADVALIFAFCVIVAYALELNAAVFIVGMAAVIVSGIVVAVPSKPVEKTAVAETPVPTYERPIVPCSAAVPANPPVEKEKPAEETPAKEEPKAAPAAKEESAPAKAEDAPAEAAKEEPVKEAVAAAAVAGAAAAEPKEEESEVTKTLRQGYDVTVSSVGEDKAEEMSDYEIMATVKEADPELYSKLVAITGIVVADAIVEEAAADDESNEKVYSDEELGLIPDTPNGFVRRACWNKGLRCRKDYGPHYIPIAFVKSKVAVYVDGATVDSRNDENLESQGWIVLHFKESDITDGAEQAEVINNAVKENTRALKKAKSKAKKKR